ncbi:valine--tRNA ligase [bacterium]|nr:valine--tRNA ligase [bacterium]
MIDDRFDPAAAEGRIYEMWEESGAFQPQGDGKPFSIVIPPPNVTGVLHVGHALNNTLQDVLTRFHRMSGKRVLWQPGTDHAGIATQMVVEREIAKEGNLSRREMGREAFLERVWAWKAQSEGAIRNQLKRLGASCDWTRERFTMDEGLSQAVIKVFVQLHAEGLIYRDKRLVNWDPHFQTAISDLEVENREVKGHFWHFKYPLENGETYTYVEKDADGNVTLEEERDYISIATTRPETMLGDGAVAVHPSDERYAPIVGKRVLLPLADRYIPIIADDYPDPEFGSGAVKITGAHDFNDYAVAKRHNLPLYELMDEYGRMRDADYVPAAYRGLDRFEARARVVADIDARGLLEKVEDKVIMQPFGDRSNVVIEPFLTDQWYVDAATLAGPAIKAVEDGRTTFHPEHWAKTYFEWMRNIEPWCVSRQLWWGHRIPAWYGPARTTAPDGKGGHQAAVDSLGELPPQVFVAMDEAAALAKAAAFYGRSVTVAADRDAARRDMLAGDHEQKVVLWQDEDVLDTWFSSALWPFSTMGWPDESDPALKDFYPTTVLSTAFDIIFFWVARMMMQGLHFMNDVPFRDVYIHALVRDAKGQKMSKSKGNVIDPLELVDEFGADALRMTLAAMAAQGRDIKLSKQRVEGYRNFSTKLWNAARFCQLNECRLDPDYDPASAKLALNRWLVSQAARTADAVAAEIEAYRFNEAAAAIYKFTWNVFCDWYLEFAKPLFSGEDEQAKAETQKTAAWALDQILHMLHPFMPFVTEALFQEAGVARGLLISRRWPAPDPKKIDERSEAEIDWLIRLITAVRSARADLNVPPGSKAPLTIVGASAATRARIDAYGALVERLARAEGLMFADAPPDGAIRIVIDEATVCLGVAGLIDMDAERVRLTKEVARLTADIAGIDKKLANPQFMERAPPEIVEEQHERRSEAEAVRAKLSDALKVLGPAP